MLKTISSFIISVVFIIIPLGNSFSQSSTNQSSSDEVGVVIAAESPEAKANLDHSINSILMHRIIEIGHFFEKFIALMDEHCL